MAMEQWNVLFSGHVQGVGFRFRTQNLAANYQVVGWVANLSDGTVRLVVEGEHSEISQFVSEIRQSMSGYIRDVQIEKSPPAGEFDNFEIRLGMR